MTTAIQPAEKALVISQYGESSEILSLAKRIKIMVPGGNKLADAEAQALAQVSLVTHCNPFIGEIWYIPGRGPMIGIKGARRHGNETIEAAGGPQAYWTIDLQPCSPEEAGAKDVKDVAAAYRGILTDSVSTALFQRMFLDTVNALRAAGSKDPVGEAREICGKRPQWVGYGYATISEQSKMNKQALAMKRTEADAIKRRFDIPFGTDVAAGDNAADAGEWVEVSAPAPINPSAIDAQVSDLHQMTIDEARQTIGNANGKKKPLGEMLADELNFVYVNTMKQATQDAAAMVLREDFRMEPPTIQKPSKEQLQKELGF